MMDTILSWVDESPEKMAAVRRFLNALEGGAIDYLGFLRTYNRFANLLFPGTSTIMTRARYFIFLPAMFREIEDMRLTEKAAREKARQLQFKLRDLLFESNREETGIIGRNAGQKVKSLPIDIYGSALSLLRIRVDGQAGFGSGFYAKLHQEREIRDEKERGRAKDELESFPSLWDPRFTFSFHFDTLKTGKDTLNFDLKKKEAQYLKEKFEHYDDDYQPSLMGFLINFQPAASLPENLDWEVLYDWRKKMPAETRENVEFAYKIQQLAQSVEQLYLIYLVRKKYPQKVDLIHETENYFSDMISEPFLQEIVTDYQKWLEAAVPSEERFFKPICEKFLIHRFNAGKVITDKTIEDIVRNREATKKGARARLASSKALDAWSTKEAPMASPLDFRFGISTRIIREIRDGLDAK